MRLAFGASALLLAVACATTTPQNTMERLQESVEAYNHAFRWKSYERASMFIPPDLRAAFIAAYEDDASSLQVEDYSILKVDLEDDRTAHVRVQVRFMLLPSVVMEKTVLEQEWHQIDGQWILETEKNSIRILDPAAKPADPRVLGRPPPPPGSEGETEVEFERP